CASIEEVLGNLAGFAFEFGRDFRYKLQLFLEGFEVSCSTKLAKVFEQIPCLGRFGHNYIPRRSKKPTLFEASSRQSFTLSRFTGFGQGRISTSGFSLRSSRQ